MTQKMFLPSLWIMLGLVGVYQLPLVENTLSKYSINISLNEYFPYSNNLQQTIEDYKISFEAYLENLNLHSISFDKPIHEAKASIPVSITHHNTVIQSQQNPPSEVHELVTTPIINICKTNCKILMIGDSVMGDVDFSLVHLLKKTEPTWQVIDAYKVSSGLTNQTYYNWPKTSEKLVSQYHPDYVVVLVGTNDAQNMMIHGKGFVLGKETWMNEYKNRILQLTNDYDSNNVKWLWIQLPVVKDLNFNKRLQFIRDVQKDTVGEHLVETETIFGKADHSEVINMKLRANDGTHLNSHGANLVAEHIFSRLSKDFSLN
jgi:hypothetical protein